MTAPIVLLVAMGVLYAAGVYLMLDRSLTRVVLGFLLVGNATNLLILLTAGPPGRPPLTDGIDLSRDGMNDPLPQALMLTAIVITFALTAFLLAMIYRSWRFVRDESLQDDIEDIRIALTKDSDSGDEAGTSGEYDDTEFGDEAASPVAGAADLDDDGTPEERGEVPAEDDGAEAGSAPDPSSGESAAAGELASAAPDDVAEDPDEPDRTDEADDSADEKGGESR